MKRKTVPNPHDAFFRRIFARPAAAAEFFRLYLPPEVVARLDLSRVTLEEAAFVDEKLREHLSDLLFRVGLKGGGAAFVYLLLEHKSAPDERVALQVLRYMVQAWDRLPAPLPWIIPVVVYHGARPWRVDRRLSGMMQPLAEPSWRRYLPDFEYYLCDLSQYRAEDLQGAEGVAPVLKLLKHIFRRELTARLPGIFVQTVQDLPDETAREQIETTMTYLAESGRVTEKQISAALAIARSTGGRMQNVLERIKDEGRLEFAVELTLLQLRQQVGKLDQATEAQIQTLPLSRLTQLGTALLGFKTREDLAKWLRQAQAPRRKQARRTAAN